MHSEDTATCTLQQIFTPLQSGERLAGRFVIQRLLGRGGCGSVYLAMDEKLGVEIALKLLERHTGDNLRREVLLARKISHPNVVRLHDLFESEQGLFFTMDYIPGESLASRLDRDQRLLPEQVSELAKSLLEALAVAHGKGVVHLDLKPDNILLDKDDRAHIVDFGIARALDEQGGAESGTPDYLSPEQLQGKSVDGRSDLFSLGVIIYEAATGCLPFAGDDNHTRMMARLSERPRAPHQLCNDIPSNLSRLTLQLLSKRPGQRPASAELAHAKLAMPASRRHWLWILPALIAVIFFLWQFAPSSPSSPSATTALPTLLVLPAEVSAPVPNWLSTAAAEQLHSQLAASPKLHLIEQKQVENYIRQMSWQTPLSRAQQEELLQAFGAVWVVAPNIRPLQDNWHLILSYGPPAHQNAKLLERSASPDLVLTALSDLGHELLSSLDGEAPLAEPIPEAFRKTISQVRRHLDIEEYDVAVPLLINLTRDWPSALSWHLTFRAYDGLGQPELATEALDKAAAQLEDPGSTLALRIQFERQRLAGHSAKALKTLQLLSRRQPFDVRLAHLNANLLAEHKGLEHSLAFLDEWLTLSPTDARGWYLLGRQQIRSGQAKNAIENPLSRALILARSQHQPTLEADVLAALGVAEERLGDLALATNYYSDALKKRESLDDKPGQAGLLANLSYLSVIAGEPEPARQMLDQALLLLNTEHAPALKASIHNDKGVLLEELGNYRDAKNEYLNALGLRRELGDPGLIAESQANVGFIAMLAGENESARVYFQQSQLGYQDMGDQRGALYVRQYLATLDSQEGRWPQATRAWLQSRREADELGDQQAQMSAMIHLAQLSLWRGQSLKAEDELAQATSLASEMQDSRAEQEILLLRAEMELRYGGDPRTFALDDQAAPDQLARQKLIEAEWLLENNEINQGREIVEALLDQPLPAWEASWRQLLAERLSLNLKERAPSNQIWRWHQGLDRESLPQESWFKIRQMAQQCSPDGCASLPNWFRNSIGKDQLRSFLLLPWVPQVWRITDGPE